MRYLVAAISMSFTTFISCKKNVTLDSYDSISIGNQVWMSKNLDVTKYQNGDPIVQVTDLSQLSNLTTGAWCYYNNEKSNGDKFGKLYNWYAVNDSRGLAPSGWRIPSDDEWWTLITNLGGEIIAGGKLKSSQFWEAPNTGASNSSNFSGYPGGMLSGVYSAIGFDGNWWTSTQTSNTTAYGRLLKHNDARIYRGVYGKSAFCSIRCIKN